MNTIIFAKTRFLIVITRTILEYQIKQFNPKLNNILIQHKQHQDEQDQCNGNINQNTVIKRMNTRFMPKRLISCNE